LAPNPDLYVYDSSMIQFQQHESKKRRKFQEIKSRLMINSLSKLIIAYALKKIIQNVRLRKFGLKTQINIKINRKKKKKVVTKILLYNEIIRKMLACRHSLSSVLSFLHSGVCYRSQKFSPLIRVTVLWFK